MVSDSQQGCYDNAYPTPEMFTFEGAKMRLAVSVTLAVSFWATWAVAQDDPSADLFRVGESAVVIIRGR